jgi:thymidylate synthase (FAD)
MDGENRRVGVSGNDEDRQATTGITLSCDITATLIQTKADDYMVVAAAKVSVDPDEALKIAQIEQEEGLSGIINYLMKFRHGTPFEHNMFTFFVEAPIFVFREWHRHRVGWSYNEWSARYSIIESKFWIPRPERKSRPVSGFKPARPRFIKPGPWEYEPTVEAMRIAYEAADAAYKTVLALGQSKELARSVLPVGTYSRMWATCNARSLMHFLSLRTHEPGSKFISYPQAEIEEAARQIEAWFAEEMPLTYEAWVANGRVAP